VSEAAEAGAATSVEPTATLAASSAPQNLTIRLVLMRALLCTAS